MERTETHIQTLANRKTILLNDFWKLNIGYIIMAFSLYIISWIITDNLKNMSSPENTIYGWIVGYDKYYDPTDGFYHLNMHGESLDRHACIYHDYYVGSEPMINIIIARDLRTKMVWAYNPDTKECGEHNNPDGSYVFYNFILILTGVSIVCVYWGEMFRTFDNYERKINLWYTYFGCYLTMLAICANIFYPPNYYGIKWFNWCLGIIINCCLLWAGLENVKKEHMSLNNENVHTHIGDGYGSGANTQCAEFEE